MYTLEIKIGCLLFTSTHETIDDLWIQIDYRKETEHSFSYTIKTPTGDIDEQGEFKLQNYNPPVADPLFNNLCTLKKM